MQLHSMVERIAMGQYQGLEEAPAGGGAMLAVQLAFMVLMVAAMWKIFTKAGKPGWAAIVPIYNVIVLLQVVNRPVWWIILLIVPLVNLVICIMVYNDLAKSFGKGIGWTIGLLLLPFIFLPLLAFGSESYVGRAAA